MKLKQERYKRQKMKTTLTKEKRKNDSKLIKTTTIKIGNPKENKENKWPFDDKI